MMHWLRATIALTVIGAIATLFAQPSLADPSAGASPPSASPTVSPAPSDDKAVTSRARDWFGRLQRGDIDRVQLTKEMSDALPADKVSQLSAALKPLGDPRSFTLIEKAKQGKFTAYRYHLDVTGGAIVFTFVLDPEAMIAGLFVSNG